MHYLSLGFISIMGSIRMSPGGKCLPITISCMKPEQFGLGLSSPRKYQPKFQTKSNLTEVEQNLDDKSNIGFNLSRDSAGIFGGLK